MPDSSESVQNQFVSLANQEVSDNQNGWILVRRGTRSKQVWIRSVVNDFARNTVHSVPQELLNLVADADYLARAFINTQRSFPAPSRSHPVLKTAIENIQAVDGNNKWNVQTLREQSCGMSAGQCGMSMNQVQRRALMKLTNFSHKHCG